MTSDKHKQAQTQGYRVAQALNPKQGGGIMSYKYSLACKEKSKANKRKHISENRSYLKSIKSLANCAICGEKRPECLQFHHIDPNNKSFELSRFKHYSKAKIDSELKKCIIVCANCHCVITEQQRVLGIQTKEENGQFLF